MKVTVIPIVIGTLGKVPKSLVKNLPQKTGGETCKVWNNNNNNNQIKARIDNKQQNCKCRLCGDRDETINHIISECSKLTRKQYKTRHDWMGKVIHRELCKKLKFDHTNKGYMHNPATVLENDTHKLIWDFNIQTDRLISARKPDLIVINKKKKKKKENLHNC